MVDANQKGFDSSANVTYIHQDKGGRQPPGGDDLEARVSRLEGDMSEIKTDLKAIRGDLSYMKGKFESAPNARDFGELKGRVDSLPTTAKLAALLAIAVAVITILNNWDKISTALFGG